MQKEEIIDWVLTTGRLEKNPQNFFTQLCNKLMDAGIPVVRFRVGFQTIHPQLDIWAFIWNKSDNITVEWGGEHGIRESSSYYGSPAEWVHTHQKTFRRRLDKNLDPETDHNVLFEQAKEGLTDYIMMPMKFVDSTIPIITFVTNHEDGFSDETVEFLERLALIVAPVIEVYATRKVATTLLDTYVGHRSGTKVMEGQIQRGDGEEIEAAIWFSDLRNFTELSNEMPQEAFFDMLNTYFQIISDSVSEENGEILKFIGDAVLVVFPTDSSRSKQDVCSAALRSANTALEKLNEVKQQKSSWAQQLQFGIGLHFGKANYGNVGSESRLDFTVIGNAVNLASRLETLTKDVDESLLTSREFADAIETPTHKIGEFELKGITHPQAVYAVS